MPVEKSKIKPDGPQSGLTPEEQKRDTATGELLVDEEPSKGEPDMRPGNQGVPSRSLLEEHPQTHPGALSPGQYAEHVVGYKEGLEPGTDEAVAHGEEFQAAKRRRRFGL
jgi:hypothetical protein